MTEVRPSRSGPGKARVTLRSGASAVDILRSNRCSFWADLDVANADDEEPGIRVLPDRLTGGIVRSGRQLIDEDESNRQSDESN